jgi:hypothetical protein
MIKKIVALATIVTAMACPAMADNGGAITGPESLVCVSHSGLQAARYGMNEKQLKSLGCTVIRSGIPVRILAPTDIYDAELFVSAELPDQVVRFWIHKSDLNAVVGY